MIESNSASRRSGNYVNFQLPNHDNSNPPNLQPQFMNHSVQIPVQIPNPYLPSRAESHHMRSDNLHALFVREYHVNHVNHVNQVNQVNQVNHVNQLPPVEPSIYYYNAPTPPLSISDDDDTNSAESQPNLLLNNEVLNDENIDNNDDAMLLNPSSASQNEIVLNDENNENIDNNDDSADDNLNANPPAQYFFPKIQNSQPMTVEEVESALQKYTMDLKYYMLAEPVLDSQIETAKMIRAEYDALQQHSHSNVNNIQVVTKAVNGVFNMLNSLLDDLENQMLDLNQHVENANNNNEFSSQLPRASAVGIDAEGHFVPAQNHDQQDNPFDLPSSNDELDDQQDNPFNLPSNGEPVLQMPNVFMNLMNNNDV